VIPPEDLSLMKKHLKILNPENPVTTVEHRIIMPGGEVRWQRWNDRAIFDPEGRIIEYQSVGRDTTDRREAEEQLKLVNTDLFASYEQLAVTEEELRQNYEELAKSQQELHKSEERYRNVVEDQTEFICRFSPEGNLIFVNDAYCRYFGLDKSSCIGLPHTVVIPPEDLSLMKKHLKELTPENPAAMVEHRIIMPDGEVRWQWWNDRATFDPEGRIIEYQSVGRDTTDRREAEEQLKLVNTDLFASYEQLAVTEEELRQNYEELAKSQQELHKSEERYRNVVEDQTEFICRFSPEGNLIFVNDAYCRYFGLDKSSCIGLPHTVVIPPEDLSLMKKHLKELTPENPAAMVEHRIIMPGGEVRWQRWNDRAIFDPEGRIIEYQSVGRDITDRLRTELALHEANKKLNLLSNLTRHDILNHLTSLQLSLENLEGCPEITEELKSWLKKASQASESIHAYIMFTRKYQNIGVEKPLWQELYSSIENISRNEGFSEVCIDKNVKGVEIFADPLIIMVFSNLFENSIRHGRTVTRIQVSGKDTSDGYRLYVDDDGEGIIPSDKEKIFQKGYGKHTGLGLFLVYEVLAITGISIQETGVYGKGARFEITVPKGMYQFTFPEKKKEECRHDRREVICS
jgi:PAS domain S-box-containing protein